MFGIPQDSWKDYQTEDFKRIFDGQSSDISRLRAFNRLSYCVEHELFITQHPEQCSQEHNEKHVAMVRWLAKAVLWNDSKMDASEPASFNPILQKILIHIPISDDFSQKVFNI